jgi:hypothetical protein
VLKPGGVGGVGDVKSRRTLSLDIGGGAVMHRRGGMQRDARMAAVSVIVLNPGNDGATGLFTCWKWLLGNSSQSMIAASCDFPSPVGISVRSPNPRRVRLQWWGEVVPEQIRDLTFGLVWLLVPRRSRVRRAISPCPVVSPQLQSAGIANGAMRWCS